MGTRNLTMVVKGGEYKVAQYCQWDGYPSGQGLTVLTFLRDEMDRERFEAAIAAVREISEDDMAAAWVDCGATPGENSVTIEVSDQFKARYLWLHRDCGADILSLIQGADGDLALTLKLGFVKDSLFCEWAYLVDLDQNTLEVYVGFNTKPLDESERFFSKEPPEKEYWPVRLVKSYPLGELPTDDQFQTDLAQDEGEEEEEEKVAKYYKVVKEYPFTVLTPNDSVMVMVGPGHQVKIDHEAGNVYVMGKSGSWVETNDRVSDALLERLKETGEEA